MRPVRVWAKAFGPFQSVDWDIPAGVTAIQGQTDEAEGIDSNGSGKSSLLNLLPIALFGPSLPWSEHLTLGSDGPCEVGCEFEHEDSRYCVVRIYSPAGRGKTELRFEREGYDHLHTSGDDAKDYMWTPLTRESQSETQALITRTLGLTEDTFLHSVFAHQGARHFANPDLPPRERKEILAQALGLGVYDELLVACRSDIKVAETSVQVAKAKVEAFAEEGASREDREADVIAQTEHLAACTERAASALASVGEAKAAYESAREQRAALSGLQDVLRAREQALANARGQVAQRQQADEDNRATLAARRHSLIEQAQRDRQRSTALAGEAGSLLIQAEGLRAKIEARPDSCDRCGQPVKGEAYAQMVAGLEANIAAAQERIAVLEREQAALNAGVDDLLVQADAIVVPEAAPAALTEEEQKTVVDAQDEVDTASGRLNTAEASLPSEEEQAALAATVLQQEIAERDARAHLAQAQTDFGRAQAALERLVETEAKQQTLLAEIAGSEDQLILLRELERAYGRDGIPALIMESTAIPKIEREAERVLDRLGVPFRVELRTQAALKTSDRLKETLEVVVHTPDGERRYESFSGGEKSRVNVALRIALARLLAHRRGASIEMFCLDEIEHLDASGVARLAELLHELSSEIPAILLVSHVEQLSDAFDNRVLVQKSGGVSQLVSA